MALARLPELRLTLTIHLYGFVRVWANSAYSWGACGTHTREHSQRQTDPCHAHLFRWKNWLYHWEKATPLQVVTIFVRRKSTLINYLGAKSDARQGTVETELWRLVSFSSALANDIRRSSHLVHRVAVVVCTEWTKAIHRRLCVVPFSNATNSKLSSYFTRNTKNYSKSPRLLELV